jgi:uncharacterized membrane protein
VGQALTFSYISTSHQSQGHIYVFLGLVTSARFLFSGTVIYFLINPYCVTIPLKLFTHMPFYIFPHNSF